MFVLIESDLRKSSATIYQTTGLTERKRLRRQNSAPLFFSKSSIEKRRRENVANATINRELSAIKRAFNLAARCTPPKVAQVPYIPMLKENNVSKGFIEHEDYQALKEALPAYLKPVLTFAYFSGWRRSEIMSLKWSQVNLRESIVRLEPGETKNGEVRTLYMEPELGVPERVAMTISGHKTRSVFDRYNIVSQEDLKEAARKRQLFSETQNKISKSSYKLVTIGSKNSKRLQS